jgi:hypothetical protein
MTQKELLDVIRRFDRALAKKQAPTFKSEHSAAQVLRLLKVAYRTKLTRTSAVDDVTRDLWEDDTFWQRELSQMERL